MVRDFGERIGAYDERIFNRVTDPVALAIAAARRKDGRTQGELAEDLGIKRSRLAMYESGKRAVPWPLWIRLTDELPELLEIEVKPDWPPHHARAVVAIVTGAGARGSRRESP